MLHSFALVMFYPLNQSFEHETLSPHIQMVQLENFGQFVRLQTEILLFSSQFNEIVRHHCARFHVQGFEDIILRQQPHAYTIL